MVSWFINHLLIRVLLKRDGISSYQNMTAGGEQGLSVKQRTTVHVDAYLSIANRNRGK